MAISINFGTSNPSSSTAYLITKDTDTTSILENKENTFLNQSIEAKHSVVTINKFDHQLFFILVNTEVSENKTAELLRKAGKDVCEQINKHKIESLHVKNISNTSSASYHFAEGLALSNYQYLIYKSEKNNNSLNSITIENGDVDNNSLNNLKAVVRGNELAKDLVNDHNGHLTSEQISKDIQTISEECGFKFEFYGRAKIESLKMGGLLAVNRASNYDPTFNIMEWKPENAVNSQPIVLVGKGVVYDTGGLSLKPTPNSMDFMKCDMAGAGAVIGTMAAVSLAKLPVHVIALVAATDNHLNEKAYGPGEVITMYSGKTVEVLNTDAEGRLTLADALHYAKKFNPELVFDIATLTGAAARAIGPEGVVYMGNAEKSTKETIESAGLKKHERLVEFPMWEEYDEQLKSDIADLKNLGGAEGGAITAGMFLQHFVDYPWLHFDIAAGAYLHTPDSYRGKNATGVGVRLFFEFLQNRANG